VCVWLCGAYLCVCLCVGMCIDEGGAPANGTEYHIIICILYSHFSQGLRVCVYGYVARICVCVCVWVCV